MLSSQFFIICAALFARGFAVLDSDDDTLFIQQKRANVGIETDEHATWEALSNLASEEYTTEYTTDEGLVGQYMWETSVGVGDKVVGLPSSADQIVVYGVQTKTMEYTTDEGLVGLAPMWQTSVGVGDKVVGLPSLAGKIVVYDVQTKTVEYNTDEGLAGNNMWKTSVGVGDKVVGLPYHADKIVVYDVQTKTVEYITDEGLVGLSMWMTSVAVDNKVVGLPYRAGKIVVYDVQTKTLEYNTDEGLVGNNMWTTSVGVGDKVVGLPYSAGKIVVYDVQTKTVEYNTDEGLVGSIMWETSVGVGDKVVGLPRSADKIVGYDVQTNTVEYTTDEGLNSTTWKWRTSVGVGNKVVGLPYSADKIVVYDVQNKTVEYNTDEGLAGNNMWKTSVGVGDKVVGLPYSAGRVLVFDLSTTAPTVMEPTTAPTPAPTPAPAALQADWFLGEKNQTCDETCRAFGGFCTEQWPSTETEFETIVSMTNASCTHTSVGIYNTNPSIKDNGHCYWNASRLDSNTSRCGQDGAEYTDMHVYRRFCPCEALPAPVLSDAPHNALQLAENSLGAAGGIMRFDDIMEDGTQLVMENVTEYTPFKPNITGLTAPNSSMAQISLDCGDKVEMVFSFLLASEPKSMDNFDFTVADLDKGAHERCAEMVEVVGYTNYSLYPSSSIQVEPGIEPGTPFLFLGTAGGSSADNPENIETMTDDQKSKAVSFVIKNRETFTVLFSTTEPGVSSDDPDVVGYNGRRILFGFGTP